MVVVEGESMLCSLLINIIEDREIDGLVADLCVQSSESDKSFGNFLPPPRESRSGGGHCPFVMSLRNREI